MCVFVCTCTYSSRCMYTWDPSGWNQVFSLITFNLIFMTGSLNEVRAKRFCKSRWPVSSMDSCLYFLTARITSTNQGCSLWLFRESEFRPLCSSSKHFIKSSSQALFLFYFIFLEEEMSIWIMDPNKSWQYGCNVIFIYLLI